MHMYKVYYCIFQFSILKMFYQKANFYKVKELLIEDDAPPTKFVKTHPGILFKHELEVL